MSTGAAIDYDDGDMPSEDRPAVYVCEVCGFDTTDELTACCSCGVSMCVNCEMTDGVEVVCVECFS